MNQYVAVTAMAEVSVVYARFCKEKIYFLNFATFVTNKLQPNKMQAKENKHRHWVNIYQVKNKQKSHKMEINNVYGSKSGQPKLLN